MIKIYTDGGCKDNGGDNPQEYGSAKVFYKGELKKHLNFTFDSPIKKTVNTAEYGALLETMQYISGVKDRTKSVLPDVVIYMDSKLVIGQSTGTMKCNAPHLKEPCEAAQAWLASNPSTKIEWISGDEMKEILGH